MENIQIETLIFFAKQVVVAMQNSTLRFSVVEDIGKKMFNEVIDYLDENNEVSEEEINLLKKYNIIFSFSSEELFCAEIVYLDIKEGKKHWQEVNISVLDKLLQHKLINQQEAVRFLAHNNYYTKAIELCELYPELLPLAQKYGSERTRINFRNYETMKSLQLRLVPKGKTEKREKI